MSIISHNKNDLPLQELIEETKNKIMREGDTKQATVNQKISLLEGLASCEFGKFLLENKGVNAYWTEYMCSYPLWKQKNLKITENQFERQLLEKTPILLATQERNEIFKREIASRFQEGVCFASLPCGLMNDLISLNTHNVNNFKLVGIDLDANALEQAKAISLVNGLYNFCEFHEIDAWKLEFKNEFNLIASNGLTIYEKDDNRVISFYEKCFTALKNKGEFLISTMTPSPLQSSESTWNMSRINPEDLLFKKLILLDIIGVNCQYNRSVEQTKNHLLQAGFTSFNILPDTQGMFVTIIAQK